MANSCTLRAAKPDGSVKCGNGTLTTGICSTCSKATKTRSTPWRSRRTAKRSPPAATTRRSNCGTSRPARNSKRSPATTAPCSVCLSVRTERQTEHGAVVAGERFEFLAGLDVPQFDLLVVAAGGERFAVRRDRQGVDRVFVAFEHVEQIPVVKVPLPHFTEPSGFAARSVQEFAIGRKGDGVHVAAMPMERAHNRARLGRAQFDLPIAGDGDEFPGRLV